MGIACAHPPGRLHRAVPPDNDFKTALRQPMAARDQKPTAEKRSKNW
jgi:hypothetical protein